MIRTRYLGALSEILVGDYLQQELGSDYRVLHDGFDNHDNHVDLKVERQEKVISIEVRGSFPYSNLTKVITEIFDFIGWYTTEYKSKEGKKDFYLRTLINQHIKDFNYEQPHTLYFVGGVTRKQLEEEGYDTDFKKDGANYRAIKPITKGWDARKIVSVIASAWE